ncbi:MAG: class I SAM-dependent RNA methyltransferase [Lachnospiraceae bacterium]|nr:class I SAM-dependent RNA methyltransferase [Lachnospiraceae bacterium]
MKKGTIFEGIVEKVNYPNKGIVRTEDGEITVKNVLPGQRVRCSVTKSRKDHAEGRLLEVLEKSPKETGKVCKNFGICGGCTYLSLDYETQKAIKEGQVKGALDRALSEQATPYVWEGVQESPNKYEYRNKMEFTFGNEYKDGPLTLGMHKRGSFFDVVPVEDCMIVDGDYRLILKTVREYFSEKGISFFHRMTHEGYLRHLLVRKSKAENTILVALVTTTQISDDAELLDGFVKELLLLETENNRPAINGTEGSAFVNELDTEKLSGKFAGILHILNDSPADVVKSDRTDILYGKDGFGEKLLGLDFQVSTFSFFQTNSAGAEVIYKTVQRYVESAGILRQGSGDEKKPVVFDLYSGTGTITQLMAPVAKKVIGVEIVEEAVEAAKRSAKANHLENCEFIAGDVLKVLDEVEEHPDFIILDPPREGIHPKALPKILDYGVQNLVYVSCKLSSLVNDLKVFRERGYEVVRATAVDQFPWTANVETVALLSKLSEAKHHY